MLNLLSSKTEVWVYMEPIDARKSYDSLYGLVKKLHSNPLSGDIFLFVSKDRKKAKALTWTGKALAIFQMRLEEGKFSDVFSLGRITTNELALFFDGAKLIKQTRDSKNNEKIYLP